MAPSSLKINGWAECPVNSLFRSVNLDFHIIINILQ
nr:MAG TPA: hypothetical protein [Caudoviricetes sp.]